MRALIRGYLSYCLLQHTTYVTAVFLICFEQLAVKCPEAAMSSSGHVGVDI